MKKYDPDMPGRLLLIALALLMAAFAFTSARADDPLNLEFKGVLIEPPPCTLNDNKTVTVDFGDRVGVHKVASGIYRQPVNVTFNCTTTNQAWQLMLSVTGNAAGFDADNATVVTPQQANLGVKLMLDNVPFVLGKKVKINGSELPTLEAVLVQRDGAILQEGEFTAQATLKAEYQ
jgi:hypothetical protein